MQVYPLAGITPPIRIALLRYPKIERAHFDDSGPVSVLTSQAIKNASQSRIRFRTKHCVREPADLIGRGNIVCRQPIARGVPVEISAVLHAIGTGEYAEPRIHLLGGCIVASCNGRIGQSGLLKRKEGVRENNIFDKLILVLNYFETKSGPFLVVEVRRKTNHSFVDLESLPPLPPVETASANLVEWMDAKPNKFRRDS
jgi:hypothetical protein